MAKRKTKRKSEHQEQTWLISMISNFYPHIRRLVFAVPNGGYRRPAEAVRLVDEGVTAGVSDVICLKRVGEFSGLIIEMKVKGGTVSTKQKEFIDAVESEGFYTAICWTGQEAFKTFEEYIRGDYCLL